MRLSIEFKSGDAGFAAELVEVLRAGLAHTFVSQETHDKINEMVAWIEWHYGIRDVSDLSDLPLFKEVLDVGAG